MQFTQDTFFSDLDDHQIVCPLPIPWNEWVKALKAIGRLQCNPLERKYHPVPNPLILGGWGASDLDKHERFMHHLKLAQKFNVFDMTIDFLNRLSLKDFLVRERPFSDVSLWDVENQIAEEIEAIQIQALPAIKQAIASGLVGRDFYDPDSLFKLFRKHGFVAGEEPALSEVGGPDWETIEALRRANKVYLKQRDMDGGARELDDFCYALINLGAKAHHHNRKRADQSDDRTSPG